MNQTRLSHKVGKTKVRSEGESQMEMDIVPAKPQLLYAVIEIRRLFFVIFFPVP